MHFPAGESKTVDHVSVVTYMKFDEVLNWAHLPVGKRGADYKAFKERKARQLLALVIEQFPEFEEAIEGYTVATPLTYRDYIGSPTGSMYGTLRDYRNALSSYIGARTKIPNLYLTGQNLNLHGLMGVSMSTLLTCSEFVDLQTLLNEINDQ
jgi:all-trans-retinol 13,14-reductase